MKTLILAAALFCSVNGNAQASAPLKPFQWLAGCWSVTSGGTQIEEQWTTPKGNIMTGMGRTVKDGKTVFFDFFRIESRKDGVFYVAQPKGNPPTEFKLVNTDPHRLVFENLQHDFPKRIIYAREAKGNVTARVEGTPEQAKMAEDFRYQRAVCGSTD